MVLTWFVCLCAFVPPTNNTKAAFVFIECKRPTDFRVLVLGALLG